jgi:plasmid stability protein
MRLTFMEIIISTKGAHPVPAIKTAPKKSDERVPLGLRVLPELRNAFKIAAAQEGRSMESKLHEVLCRELDRKDLLSKRPA